MTKTTGSIDAVSMDIDSQCAFICELYTILLKETTL